MEKLANIQAKLKAPKNQYNNFGKYKYRSCEDILEAVKPLLDNSIMTISDEVVEVGGRVYVKATVSFSDGENTTIVTAFAREADSKKGMDASQITGAASSYARKYALNGLFLIDDTKDFDTMDNREDRAKPKKTGDTQKTPAILKNGAGGNNEITDAQRNTLIALMEQKALLKTDQKAFFDYATGGAGCSAKIANDFIRDFDQRFEEWVKSLI